MKTLLTLLLALSLTGCAMHVPLTEWEADRKAYELEAAMDAARFALTY